MRWPCLALAAALSFASSGMEAHALPSAEDLTLRRPIRCFVPRPDGGPFVVPLEEHSNTPSERFVDGNDRTYIFSEYNFDCYVDLGGPSTFTAVRISWQWASFMPAILSWDCEYTGVGSWRLHSSDDGVMWTPLAGEEGPLVNWEDVVPLAGEGSLVKLEVRMQDCPPIGGYTLSVFGDR